MNKNNIESLVDQVIKKIGNKIVLASPLGAGKANHLINAFYERAKADQQIDLTICTALTLQRPTGKSEFEKRFIQLFDKRIFGNYPDLAYELDRVEGEVPSNIQIIEFYFTPGKYLDNTEAQRNYISSNYTHIVRDAIDRGVNVVVQMVSKRIVAGEMKYSLSSNPDITLDLVKYMRENAKDFLMIGQVNENLPFMYGDALVDESFFDFVEDNPEQYYTVFGTPKMSVSDADYMIGLYCSALVRDDGEIQIGIGSLGDASIYNLLIRQKNNEVYNEMLDELNVYEKFGSVLIKCGGNGRFEKGLFGASEMIVDGFRHLYENGIIKKKVYDDLRLQGLLNRGIIHEHFDVDVLKILRRHKLIHNPLSREDFNYLQYWGILKEELNYIRGRIVINETQHVNPDIHNSESYDQLKEHCLGTELKNGQIMHGGFFLGPQSFYQWLKDLPEEECKRINMRSVQKVNQLYGHEELDRLHRKNARFINTCMIQTLAGAAVSDGLEDGRVVSGVGGQYNFVAMAQELPDGYSIINLRSTRSKKGKCVSNIVPFYGHITIPRHLRDIVVTEYGIAQIRGKTDEEIIQQLLNICDSRFQPELMKWAKDKGKLAKDYKIPIQFQKNYPQQYQDWIKKYKEKGFFPPFPFGTELSNEEIQIGKALKSLKADLNNKPRFFMTVLKSVISKSSGKFEHLLKMMKLDKPKGVKELLYKKILDYKLSETQTTLQT